MENVSQLLVLLSTVQCVKTEPCQGAFPITLRWYGMMEIGIKENQGALGFSLCVFYVLPSPIFVLNIVSLWGLDHMSLWANHVQ